MNGQVAFQMERYVKYGMIAPQTNAGGKEFGIQMIMHA